MRIRIFCQFAATARIWVKGVTTNYSVLSPRGPRNEASSTFLLVSFPDPPKKWEEGLMFWVLLLVTWGIGPTAYEYVWKLEFLTAQSAAYGMAHKSSTMLATFSPGTAENKLCFFLFVFLPLIRLKIWSYIISFLHAIWTKLSYISDESNPNPYKKKN